MFEVSLFHRFASTASSLQWYARIVADSLESPSPWLTSHFRLLVLLAPYGAMLELSPSH